MEPLVDILTDVATDAMADAMQSNKTPKVIKGCFFGFFVIACLIFAGVVLFAENDFLFGKIIGLAVSGGFAYLGIRYIVNLFRKDPKKTDPAENNSDPIDPEN